MSLGPTAAFFGSTEPTQAAMEPTSFTIDADAPPGSHRHPLGSAQNGHSYLLGLSCACGKTSLVYAAALEGGEAISCPGCLASLT